MTSKAKNLGARILHCSGAWPIVGSLLLVACGRHEPAKTFPAVRVQAASRGSIAASSRYSASIDPRTHVDLAFKVGGYVATIATRRGPSGLHPLQDGEPVRRGEVLAQLRTADFEERRSQTQAAASEAQAAFVKAAADYQRASSLQVGVHISQAALDSARAAADGARAHVAGARAQLDEAITSLQDSALRSPIDGTVSKRFIEVGNLVAPGTLAFSIVDTSSVKVVFGVPDTMVARLRVGTAQVLTAEAVRGKVFQGTVTRIAPTADPRTRLFEVEVSVDNPEAVLKPGMIASLPLELQESAGAAALILVPLAAVVRSPAHRDAYAVFVAGEANNRTVVKAREVTLGEFTGNDIAVVGGLAGNEHIVVSGASLLSDGEIVRVIQ